MRLTKYVLGIAMVLLISTMAVALTEEETEANDLLIIKTVNSATKAPYYKDLQKRAKTETPAEEELDRIDLLIIKLRQMGNNPPEEVKKTSEEILKLVKVELRSSVFDRARQWIAANPALGTAGKVSGIGLGVIVLLLLILFMYRRYGRKGKTAVDAIVGKGKAMFGDIERHLTAEERWIDEFKRQY